MHIILYIIILYYRNLTENNNSIQASSVVSRSILASVVSFSCIMGILRNPSAFTPHDSLHNYRFTIFLGTVPTVWYFLFSFCCKSHSLTGAYPGFCVRRNESRLLGFEYLESFSVNNFEAVCECDEVY